ncbi:NnrS family protein [Pseudoalteromonas sp. T1lg22]|uniref:NnrS family protein n=1 Tax=Pseudoalteromonas sp. T1lg22 TaxID=2077096 RepID=UPI0018F89B5E|nr:NnrS family protein [Pseudoalteromonas sp. T1lg22]
MAVLLPSGQIAEPDEKARGWAFMRLAFRPLFWLGALFGMLSIITWSLTYTGHLAFSPYGGGYFWHTHEMLFGFAVAIMSGFLLTAVQNWTGVPSIKGKPLAALVLLWLSARILMALPGSWVPSALVIAVDIAFLPAAALCFALPIIKAQLVRNLFFVPLLLVMAALNLLMHLSQLQWVALNFITLSHTMVLMVALVMVIIGGRVFPMFTANGTQTPKVDNFLWLDKAAIISVLVCALLTLVNSEQGIALQAMAFIAAALINFVRAWRWRIWVTFGTALVWPLHLSYWAICIGLLMLGLMRLEVLSNPSLAYHAITVGGMGLMILAMISRVSLGHTGRMIKVGWVINSAFIALFSAFVIRVFAPLVSDQYQSLILVSALLWTLAYLIYIIAYAPVVFKPRVDGRDG